MYTNFLNKKIALSGNQALEDKRKEVVEAEDEVEELREVWEEHKEEMEMEINQLKKAYELKRQEIVAKEEKIDYYEENYGNLIREFKREMRHRHKLIDEYQKMPKDMTREQLASMIFQIKKKSRANEDTTLEKVDELKEVS